ncbi:MAG: glycosyltransferase family 39 protein [Anaerolineae bacterium]|nr:glycosyltransferase family 39 protein [Anaerolineae bacterium]
MKDQVRHITILILLLAFGLRVFYLTEDRFHADEALYAGWALRLLDGDPLLLGVPVDKPPLFLYTLAGAFTLFGPSEVAGRWISLTCSMVSIALIYRLARASLSSSTGRQTAGTAPSSRPALWATFFFALSPFDILFARTTFTDAMLVMWVLAALCATVHGHRFRAGILTGLAFATKQHAVVLIPLIVALQGWSSLQPRLQDGYRVFVHSILSSALGFFVPWGIVTWWDSVRWQIRPGYWDQSALSYGGLVWAPAGEWSPRFVEWLGWARYLAGSTITSVAFAAGVVTLLVWSWRRRPRTRETWLDTLWSAAILAYLVFHSVLAFSIWDRYLLPLAVPVALLSARIVTSADRALGRMTQRLRHATSPPYSEAGERAQRIRPAASVTYKVLNIARGGVPYLVAGVVLAFGIRAAINAYPIGGEHWAYQGVDEVTDYLKESAASNAVLYHHWLRWHYTFYLHGTDLELRWWQDGAHLRQEARKSPNREQYIVLPAWRPLDPSIDGVRFVPLLETRRRDGSTSLLLCRVELDPWDD